MVVKGEAMVRTTGSVVQSMSQAAYKAPNGPPPISGLLVQTGLMDHWFRPV